MWDETGIGKGMPVAKRGQADGVTIEGVKGGIHDSIIVGGNVSSGNTTPSDGSERPAPNSEVGTEYDIATIRQLLLAAFTSQTLRRFCQDQPVFRPVVNDFGPGHSLNEMVDRVIDYCEMHLFFDELLAHMRKVNPGQYARFEPFGYPFKPRHLGVPEDS